MPYLLLSFVYFLSITLHTTLFLINIHYTNFLLLGSMQILSCYKFIVALEFIICTRCNVNKCAWEGILKVINKGEEFVIKLEDIITG